jgi:hypothetical protein
MPADGTALPLYRPNGDFGFPISTGSSPNSLFDRAAEAQLGGPLKGRSVDSRTTPAPKPGKGEQEAFVKKAEALAPKFRTELLPP